MLVQGSSDASTAHLSIVAVIVIFDPDMDTLAKLLSAVSTQVSQCCLIINRAPVDLESQLKLLSNAAYDLKLLGMGSNVGVARAQNAGIAYAREFGAHYVLLLDQDSLPGSDMVLQLSAVFERNPQVAAAGPCYLDPRQQNPPPFIRVRGLRLERVVAANDSPFVSVDYLISSGCLISLRAIDKVGGMRDDLFIDYVDIEWGLRARAAGFECVGVFPAHMTHSLGDQPISIFGRFISMHSPLRNYYLVRNAILLYQDRRLPINWKLVDGWRLARRVVFYLIFGEARGRRFMLMLRGLRDGLLNRGGEFREH